MGKNSIHYVNNIEFADALVVHRNKIFAWKESINSLVDILHTHPRHTLLDIFYLRTVYEYIIVSILNKPRVSPYLITQLTKISTGFAQRPLYINRLNKEDMINAAVENCLKYITNFNPAVTTNAFSYFSQITYYSFLRSIYTENNQRNIESKIIAECEFSTFFSGDGIDDNDRQSLKEQLELKLRTVV